MAYRHIALCVFVAVLVGMRYGAARADDFVSELRAGALRHDAGIITNHKENGADFNGEVLFSPPEMLSLIWSPRPHIGLSVNSLGLTSQVYGGLTWSYDFADWLFGEFSFGPSLHDGKLDKSDPSRKALGSPVEFRESLSLGWRIDDHNNLSVMVDHISNGGLARYNGGMDGVGLRYGYRF